MNATVNNLSDSVDVKCFPFSWLSQLLRTLGMDAITGMNSYSKPLSKVAATLQQSMNYTKRTSKGQDRFTYHNDEIPSSKVSESLQIFRWAASTQLNREIFEQNAPDWILLKTKFLKYRIVWLII